MTRHDVVIVGGGIAGGALGAMLASAGVDVLVLERVREFKDRVRGEYMQPWGAAEMLRIGVDQVLLDAGGGWCRSIIRYDELVEPAQAEATAIDLTAFPGGAPGAFCVGHPEASDALNVHAGACGATVVRGVDEVEITAGLSPRVRWTVDGTVEEAECRLIVGADGRQSSVRRTLGIELDGVESQLVLGGMLVRTDDWLEDAAVIGTEDDRHFLAFPRPNGYVRLYDARVPSDRTAGPDRARHMLEGFRLSCVPNSEALATAVPAGPCGYFQGTGTWTEMPAADAAVLIGDAAGWNDPMIGCGLSIALRDVRIVGETLLESDDWSTDAFRPYAEERMERLRRLRMSAHLTTELECTFTPEGRARRERAADLMGTDSRVFAIRACSLIGPEVFPDECFTDDAMELALAYS